MHAYRNLLRWTMLMGATSLTLLILQTAVRAAPRPNIILVMTDDQGYGDLGCHGNSMIRTPNLDQLHKESARLTDFHVDPTCSPTRSALMTGRYSSRTGVWHTIMGRSLMRTDEVTLAELLAEAGYINGIFGKWHLGDNYPLRPQDQGFHEVLVHGGGGIGQTPDPWDNDYFDDTYLHNGREEKFEGYCTKVFFDQALSFIDRQRKEKEPFFVYLPTNVPHSPYLVADRYRQYYAERGVPGAMARFYGMIENFDEHMGRLRAQLKAWDLEENTIFIFMTDNGTAEGIAWPGDKEPAATSWKGYNAGLRGKKGSEYDGGHKVPFFIRWPQGNIQGGRDVPQLTAHIDVLPTLLDLVDIPLPRHLAIDGKSLAPLLKQDKQPWPERSLVVHSQRIEQPEKWRKSAMMTDRWRLINGKDLYDIVSDPSQESNLAAQYPQEVARLRAHYESWWESLQPAFDQYAWIGVGADQDNPTHITCHDWHSNEVPWHHGMIKNMPVANGYWMVEVMRDGDYAFTLRHQPVDAKFPLQATRARLRIGEAEATHPVSPNVTAVTLSLPLKTGRYKMQSWLEDEKSDVSRGAFYVEAMRMMD